jgi:predicted small lipoprotein YifL
MKKFAALALLLGLFAVVGCEGKKEPAAAPPADTTAPAEGAPAEAPAETPAQ